MNTTDKESINRLVEICYLKGIRNVVFSPGSRNAPLVIAFHAAQKFNIKTIPDERVAAFYALGQGIATGIPSIICCTSGSAALNYAPAIVEAYYQNVPLLILTADRPGEWIDHGIGQSMRQNAVYANYIKESYTWIEEATTKEDLLTNDSYIAKAIDSCTRGAKGPVHINIPFQEPLYVQKEYVCPDVADLSAINTASEDRLDLPNLRDNDSLKEFTTEWQQSTRKIILCGLLPPQSAETELLARLSERQDIVLLTETTSNVRCSNSIQCLDRVLHRLTEAKNYQPDLLISIGGPIISKKIKQFLLKNKPASHWQLHQGQLQDTFRANPRLLALPTGVVLSKLKSLESKNATTFQNNWELLQQETSVLHDQYLDSAPYSDLLVFEAILKALPPGSQLHLANSTPIRYAQLFDQRQDLTFCSNRGVSGIDGSTSTALGVASMSENKDQVLVTGDMSFFYDSNAFWQPKMPLLKVILINNGGGGIFRYIPGPGTTNQLEQVFESHHDLSAEHLCKLYNLEYYKADSIESAKTALDVLFQQPDSSCVLEIFTPRKVNADILIAYFQYMKREL